jgi:hypothetical protein
MVLLGGEAAATDGTAGMGSMMTRHWTRRQLLLYGSRRQAFAAAAQLRLPDGRSVDGVR